MDIERALFLISRCADDLFDDGLNQLVCKMQTNHQRRKEEIDRIMYLSFLDQVNEQNLHKAIDLIVSLIINRYEKTTDEMKKNYRSTI